MITTKISQLVTTKSDGAINVVHVHVGDHVQKGAALVDLDTKELESKARALAAQAKGQHADANASYATAHDGMRQVGVQTMLYKGGAGTREGIAQARAQASQAGSQGQAASERAKSTEVDLEETTRLIKEASIVSPIEGDVVSLTARAGASAQRGTTVARISDTSDLRVKFTVPLEVRRKLTRGQVVEVVMPNAPRNFLATIVEITDVGESRLPLAVVEADIDDSKLTKNELSPTAQGHVRIAGGKS